MRPKMPHASFAPALMPGRVARSIHMRTTAIGCRKQTSNSRSFFTVRNLPPAPADNPRDDRADDNQPGRGPLMTAGNGGADQTALWNGFANMATLAGRAVTIVRGEGATVFDAAGRPYLDAIASLWYSNVGHGRAELADAAAAQMHQLAAYQTVEPFSNLPAESLARRVAALAPPPHAKGFLPPPPRPDPLHPPATPPPAHLP